MTRPFTILLLFFLSVSLVSHADGGKQGYTLGDTIVDFKLLSIDGTHKSLKNYEKEKGIILIFTCNHCPFSVAYEDRIIALHKKYAMMGYPVLAINPNDPTAKPIDSYENMVERAEDKAFPFDYLQDETQEIAKRFGATKTPHVYILKRQQKIFTVEYIGAIDDNAFEPDGVHQKFAEYALDQLTKDLPVSLKETKAVGCGIKWKK